MQAPSRPPWMQSRPARRRGHPADADELTRPTESLTESETEAGRDSPIGFEAAIEAEIAEQLPVPSRPARSSPPPLASAVSPARLLTIPAEEEPEKQGWRVWLGAWRPEAFAISLGVHVVILALLALIVLPRLRHQDLIATLSAEADPGEIQALETIGPIEMPNEAEESTPSEEPVMFDQPALGAHLSIDGDLIGPIGGIGEVTGLGGGDGEAAGRLAKAGAKSGTIQISLFWENHNDLDLHVLTPSGEEIYFGHRFSRERGELDVDMNVRGETNKPVENVVWTGKAPRGQYAVAVHEYRNNGDPDPTTFKVRVVIEGRAKWLKPERISLRDGPKIIYKFSYPEKPAVVRTRGQDATAQF